MRRFIALTFALLTLGSVAGMGVVDAFHHAPAKVAEPVIIDAF